MTSTYITLEVFAIQISVQIKMCNCKTADLDSWKIPSWKIGGVTWRRLEPNSRKTCSTISKHLYSLGMTWKMDTATKKRGNATIQVWTATWTIKSERVLRWIFTGNQKWIYYDNPKRKKSFGKPCINNGNKAKYPFLEVVLCIWWDQLGKIYDPTSRSLDIDCY